MFNILCHKKLQIKISTRYHYTPLRLAKIQNTDNNTSPHTGKDVEQQELSFTANRNGKQNSHLEDSLTVIFQN